MILFSYYKIITSKIDLIKKQNFVKNIYIVFFKKFYYYRSACGVVGRWLLVAGCRSLWVCCYVSRLLYVRSIPK